jgi:DGQHR domain-containing protein
MKMLALKVNQWLEEWDEVLFDPRMRRTKPNPFFYLVSLPARDLQALCGIYPRISKGRKKGSQDLGIQRSHDPERSDEIMRFVRFGHPWAGLSLAKQKSAEYDDLRKPGWLPTAIVVNILRVGDNRQGKSLAAPDQVNIEDKKGRVSMILPVGYSGPEWRTSSVPPIEVIDGQHRLWAFQDFEFDGTFELPVVAFHGLDISWQAYLFYIINLKPKRINASLAFDLYPLLRTEDWLEKFEGPDIYRETRAQELVDILYSHVESPWHERINMLGEKGTRGKMVTQAAWVRALMASFVKRWEGQRVTIGGLFGAPVGSHEQVLPWSRLEQAAFLIGTGQAFKEAVKHTKATWTKALRERKQTELFQKDDDAAFAGRHSLISQDQGIRALLNIANDLCFLAADDLQLIGWGSGGGATESDPEEVSKALAALKKTSAYSFLRELAKELARFDWRSSDAPGLLEEERLMKAAFRGSGGYKELRKQLLIHLEARGGHVGQFAAQAIELLHYD